MSNPCPEALGLLGLRSGAAGARLPPRLPLITPRELIVPINLDDFAEGRSSWSEELVLAQRPVLAAAARMPAIAAWIHKALNLDFARTHTRVGLCVSNANCAFEPFKTIAAEVKIMHFYEESQLPPVQNRDTCGHDSGYII